METISMEEHQKIVDAKNEEIQELKDKVEELEDDPCDCEDAEGYEYIICGEKVYINCDNIAHQTFFELLEDKTSKFSINELTSFLQKL